MRTPPLVVVFALAWAAAGAAQADTSDSSDIKNHKMYGNCYVLTNVDMFTDDEWHTFGCQEETLTDHTEIVIGSGHRGLGVFLSKGAKFHFDETIPVAIRVDKGPLIRRSAMWISEGARFAFIHDEQLARSLLHDLARGQRVAIRVGNESGRRPSPTISTRRSLRDLAAGRMSLTPEALMPPG